MTFMPRCPVFLSPVERRRSPAAAPPLQFSVSKSASGRRSGGTGLLGVIILLSEQHFTFVDLPFLFAYGRSRLRLVSLTLSSSIRLTQL
jgi:hypothetical protein